MFVNSILSIWRYFWKAIANPKVILACKASLLVLRRYFRAREDQLGFSANFHGILSFLWRTMISVCSLNEARVEKQASEGINKNTSFFFLDAFCYLKVYFYYWRLNWLVQKLGGKFLSFLLVGWHILQNKQFILKALSWLV